MLFIQGVGVTGAGWSPQVRELARDHSCVFFDNRGIGQSSGDVRQLSVEQMARDTLALLDALQITRAHVVGHSLGGVIAQCLALRAPARVQSLTLMCTFAGGRDLRLPSGRLMWLGLRSQLGTRQMRREGFARLVTPESYIAARGMAQVVAELEDVFARELSAPPSVTDRQLTALRKHDERSRLGELGAIPTLVMSGKHDPIARPEFGRALTSGIGSARFSEWASASHALPIQESAAVNQELRAHFAGAP